MPLFASSPILTSAVAGTRKADSNFLTFGAIPQGMSIYVDFIECGAVFIANGGLLTVSYAANPQLVISSTGTVYRAVWARNNIVSVASTLAAAPVIGQRCEIVVTLTAAGVIQIQQSIESGAIASGTASAALALPQAWGGTNVALGVGGGGSPTVTGGTALLNVLIEAGVQSFATMRAIAGTQ